MILTNLQVILSVTPHSVGELRISGIAYHLSNPPMYCVPEAGTNNLPSTVSIPGKQVFNIRCPRAKFTKERINQDMKDRRLEINVVPSAPCLQVSILFCFVINSSFYINSLFCNLL